MQLIYLFVFHQHEWKAGVGQDLLGSQGPGALVNQGSSLVGANRSRPSSMRLTSTKGTPFDVEKTVESLVSLVLAVAFGDGSRFRSRASPGQAYSSQGGLDLTLVITEILSDVDIHIVFFFVAIQVGKVWREKASPGAVP